MLLALIFGAFLFPAFSDEASLPKDWSSEELGRYLGNVLAYWKRVFAEASKRLTGQFSFPSLTVTQGGVNFGKKSEST